MRRIFLMSSVLFVAPFVFGESGEVSAQCVATQDCASLGYTEASCPNGGIKCPFGNTWSCKGDGTTKPSCDSSYKYTCTGANQKPGADSCDGKYKSCKCASGYEWKNGVCSKKEIEPILGQCTGYAKNCAIGDILNSDGTCTTNKESGKTPIGVVVYIGSDNCGQALSLKDLGAKAWSPGYADVPGLPNYGSTSAAESDYDSCNNTQKIIQAGDAAEYPAAWAAVTYAPDSAPGTKGKWCLPAAGIGRAMMARRPVINAALATAGGDVWPTRANPAYWNWTSSELDDAHAWAFMINRDDGLNFSSREERKSYYFVRPVIMF